MVYLAKLIGITNSGKSTFINKILKEDFALVNKKIQTTQNFYYYKYKLDNDIFYFVDTPGIQINSNYKFKLKYKNDFLANESYSFVIIIIDINNKNTDFIFKKIINMSLDNVFVHVILNKIDLISRDELHKKLFFYNETFKSYQNIELFPVSLLKKINLNSYYNFLKNIRYQKKMSIPQDIDQNISYIDSLLLCSHISLKDIVWSVILDYFHKEIPYSTLIKISKIDVFDKNYFKIEIVVTKRSIYSILKKKDNFIFKKIKNRIYRYNLVNKYKNIYLNTKYSK